MDALSYKALHVLGLFLVFTGLGGLMVQALTGSDNRAPAREVR